MILVLGHLGNMGIRYTKILDHLNTEWKGLDTRMAPLTADIILDAAKTSAGVIIATPTRFHEEHLEMLCDLGVPVLCEKPLSKDLANLKRILLRYQESHTPLSMILQYKELLNDAAVGASSYNYFKTGSDGLAFDCIQIIGLAKGTVSIANDSPTWECTINGQRLNLADMDQAYVWNVMRWLKGDYQNLKEIYAIHERVKEYIETNEGSNRDTGPLYVSEVPQ